MTDVIEIYMVAKKSNSPSFDHTTVCRECAKKFIDSCYVEFDKWAFKFPDEYEGSICEICGSEIELVEELKEMEGADYD